MKCFQKSKNFYYVVVSYIGKCNTALIMHKHLSKCFVFDHKIVTTGPPNTFFFFWKILKRTYEYFLKFGFFFESTILPVNNGK